MNEILLTAIVGAFTTFIGSFATWIFTRRKNNADAKGSELDNVGKAIEMWRKLAEEMNDNFNDALKELENVRTINVQLQTELAEIKRQVKLLLCENEKLKNMIKDLTSKKME